MDYDEMKKVAAQFVLCEQICTNVYKTAILLMKHYNFCT
jgi:hypothetical protein